MKWALNPNSTPDWDCEGLIDDEESIVAYFESFGDDRFYPHAVGADGYWYRGGCFRTAADAKAWAERTVGLHPKKAGDERSSSSSPFASPPNRGNSE